MHEQQVAMAAAAASQASPATATVTVDPDFEFAPPSAVPSGVRHRALPRLRSRSANFDLHVFADRIVLDPVKGRNPENVGAVVGFFAFCGVLGAVLGSLIGRQVAKSGNAARLARSSWTSAEDLAANGAEQVLHENIASLVARHHGSGGRLQLAMASGEVRKFSWSSAYVKGIDVDGMLLDASPGRSMVYGVSVVRTVARIALFLFGMLLSVGLVGSVLLAVRSEPSVPDEAQRLDPALVRPAVAARAPLARACTPWITLAAESEPATAEEIHGIVKATRPDFEAAAAADSSLQPAANAVAFLDSYLTLPSTGLQDRVEPAAATVDAACERS